MAVYRKLAAYTIAPNRSNETHCVFSDPSYYGYFLSSHNALDMGSLNQDSFRELEGKILLTGEHFLISDYRKILYFDLYEVDDFTAIVSKHRYYYVKTAYEKSGYFVYEVEPDLWANEIANATFSQFHIARCNRELGNGIYDEVKATKSAKNYYYGASLTTPISDYCCVFSASIVLQTGWFGSNPLTQTFLFYLPLEDIDAAAVTAYENLGILEKVRFVIGGIKTILGYPVSANAQVLRCWILPKTAVSGDTLGVAAFETKSVVTGNNDYQFANVKLAKCGERRLTFDFTTFLGSQLNNLYPDTHIEFGTRGHTMPLTRYTANKNVFATIFVTSGDVRVQVEQGNNIMDVSQAFELDLNINNQVGNATQQLAKTAGKLLAIFASTAKAYAVGGTGAAAVNAASGLFAMREGNAAPASGTSNGDAMTTYGLNDPDYLMYPFIVASVASNSNEDENAYFMGASYDDYNANFALIETYTHLGAVTQAQQRDGTYILSDNFKIAGVSAAAEDYIRSEFRRGIWIKALQ